MAELHNKFSSHSTNEEKKEDILTSNVFGVLKYLDKPQIMERFLRCAESINAKDNEECEKLEFSGVDEYKFHFWPKLENGREADLLIQGFINKELCYNFLIEVKYLSGKSDSASEHLTGDQLADEYLGLMNNCWKSPKRINVKPKIKSALIYVTAHYVKPEAEIEESMRIIRVNNCKDKKIELYWVSIRNVYDLISQFINSYPDSNKIMLADLQRMLKRKRLGWFPFDFSVDEDYCYEGAIDFIFIRNEETVHVDNKKLFDWNVDDFVSDKIKLWKGNKKDE